MKEESGRGWEIGLAVLAGVVGVYLAGWFFVMRPKAAMDPFGANLNTIVLSGTTLNRVIEWIYRPMGTVTDTGIIVLGDGYFLTPTGSGRRRIW